MGMWHDNLYLEVHDDYLICLDAKTGHEKWKERDLQLRSAIFFLGRAHRGWKPHSRGDRQRYGRARLSAIVRSETGTRQWIAYTVPMKAGDKGLDTWATLDAAQHGGGQAWIPGAYDPETHLYIFGTGNPTPAYTTAAGKATTCTPARLSRSMWTAGRSLGIPNLASRHARLGCHGDAHFVDAPFNGQMRKMALTGRAQRILLHSGSCDR